MGQHVYQVCEPGNTLTVSTAVYLMCQSVVRCAGGVHWVFSAFKDVVEVPPVTYLLCILHFHVNFYCCY